MTTYGIDGVDGHRRLEARRWHSSETAVMAVSVLVAAVLGLALNVSPTLAVALVVSVGLLAVLARFGLVGIGVVLTATLPWLIVASGLLPRLAVTFTAAATAGVAALLARPASDGSRASIRLRIGMALFCAPIVISLAFDSSGIASIQAAKLLIFPLMVMVIAEPTNRADLLRLRTVALWSSSAAVIANLVVGWSGIANISYYQSGEILGFASQHTLALLAGCIVAASIAGRISWISASVAALAAVAAVATGVRSVLPGLALVLLVRMFYGQVRLRVILLVALAAVGIFASGAADVVQARFERAAARGEFSSLSSVGSGRGEIYTVAVQGWWDSGPLHWIVGTGLRSILRFEEEKLGSAFVGHSDFIEVGVQLGLIGLVGLILIWWVLIERAGSKLPLIILASMALFNGVLEYGGAIVIGLLLAGPAHRPDGTASVEVRAAPVLRRVSMRGRNGVRYGR